MDMYFICFSQTSEHHISQFIVHPSSLTQTDRQTDIHTYIHANTHTDTDTRTQTHIRAQTHTHTYTHIHADRHVHTQTHVHRHTYTDTHTCTDTETDTLTCTHTHMHRHRHKHAQTQTHRDTHTHFVTMIIRDWLVNHVFSHYLDISFIFLQCVSLSLVFSSLSSNGWHTEPQRAQVFLPQSQRPASLICVVDR